MSLSQITELDLDSGKTKFYKQEVLDLYYRVLSNSNSWDLGLGFFSLSSIKLLAYPLAKFILNNSGKMRVYCNERLSENDYNIISENKVIPLNKTNVFNDLNTLYDSLKGNDQELFSQCIAFLIQTDRIEFKVLVCKDSSRGISHHKNSIFKDDNKNTVVLSGSANASEQAFIFNREDTNAFCSFWNEKSSNKTINTTINEFEKTFHEGDEDWNILEIDSKELKDKLDEIGFRKIDSLSLDKKTKSFSNSKKNLFSRSILDEIDKEIKTINDQPHFPRFNGKISKPREYQMEAYNNWVNNDRKGLFAMATGTGKTITSLNCIVEDYNINGFYKFIVLVPTRALLTQWDKEVRMAFNFKDVYLSGTKGFYESLPFILREDDNYAVITTYSAFKGDRFQSILKDFNDKEEITLIADEAHTMGSSGFIKILPNLKNINFRIGLSATPSRYFDEIGEKEVFEFFNIEIVDGLPNYTTSFTISEAIHAKPTPFLCPYNYYPKFVDLEQDEMLLYKRYTIKLMKFIDNNGVLKKCVEVENLLKLRKDVIKKAKLKKQKLIEIIREIGIDNFKYAFVYVPEGKEINYGEEDIDWTIENDVDKKIIINYTKAVNKAFNYKIGTRHFTGATKDRDTILKDFEQGRTDTLFAMKCLDEGVDVPRTEIAIFCSSTGNPRQYVQRRGRVLRMHKNKDIATIYDMIVIPTIANLKKDGGKEFACEKNLVIGEIRRLIAFSKDSNNQDEVLYNTDLIKICDFFNIELNKLIN